MPQWKAFHEVIGGLIAELRLQYPTVRAYGEMVDVLWQRGERDAAIRLEEYWNELGRLQTFSLFCAYRMDPLDARPTAARSSACARRTRTSFRRATRARSTRRCSEASRKVLDQPLAQLLLSLAANHQATTQMPSGQATLLLAEAEHAAHRRQDSREIARRSAQRAAGESFASRPMSSPGS